MRRPPPPGEFVKYPVTVCVGALAVVATLLWWQQGDDVSRLVMNYQVWDGQPWRLLTSCLLHVTMIHLVFNLYWLWVFGSVIEEKYGQLATAAIYLLFAAGSSAAEYAIFRGGVGLSGVGYGLFGLLWILSKKDERFSDVVDQPTVVLFVAWFFLCILLTATDALPVANVAHGIGAVQGVLLGFALAGRREKYPASAGLVALMAVIFLASSVYRPYVNFSHNPAPGDILAVAAYKEQRAGNNEHAASLYEQALRYDDQNDKWWRNLAVAYMDLDRVDAAFRAAEKAAELAPDDVVNRQLLDALRRLKTRKK